MRKRLSFYVFLLLLAIPSALAYQSWGRIAASSSPEFFQTVCSHPAASNELLLATPHRIYTKNSDSPEKLLWQPFLSSVEIQALKTFPELRGSVFALAKQKIYLGDLPSSTWREIFHLTRRGDSILSLAVHPGNSANWFIGTSQGLFESKDSGKSWAELPFFRNKSVPLVFFHQNIFFAAAGESIYRSADFNFFEKSFAKNFFDGEEFFDEIEEENSPENASESPAPVSVFFHDQTIRPHSSQLWLATAEGVFESIDAGRTWQKLTSAGLQNTETRRLVFSEETQNLYASTNTDVYAYSLKTKTWAHLFQGMTRPVIFDLHLSSNRLWAATSDGLMEFPLLPDNVIPAESSFIREENLLLLKTLFRLEPGVRDLQHWVIRYANVHNNKTKNWHRLSHLRALFPSFSFGKDFSRGNSIDLDRGSTSEPDVYIAGPDDVDKGWDADVSWDFGDLLFSSNQTSIDSREKLMIELRNDLLSEATRIYFERRRLQMEIVLIPADTAKDHFDRLIRMDELTALLDSLSDGKFGKGVKEIYIKRPELEDLWAMKNVQRTGETKNTQIQNPNNEALNNF